MVPILTIFSSAEHIESFHPILTEKIIPDPVESGSGWIRDFFLEPDPDKNEKTGTSICIITILLFFASIVQKIQLNVPLN